MNVLLIVNSTDPEIKWNAVRFGSVLLEAGDDVNIFLNGPAASFYDGDSAVTPLKEQAKLFALSDGSLHV